MEKEPEICKFKLINMEHIQPNEEGKVDLSDVKYNRNKRKVLSNQYPGKRKDSMQSYRKKRLSVGRVFYLFCTTTSIRGMSKIPRGPIFLRLIWFSFVLIMTAGLALATTFMVLEYLQYDVNVYTKIILDDNSSFPALTICHHHPFSIKAYDLWNRNLVMSPSKYNKFLRELSNSSFKNNNYDEGFNAIHFDTMSMYYQNLRMNDSYQIGHDKSTYLTCMNQLGYKVNFHDDCSELHNTSFHRLSHHEYFNCHTFEPVDTDISYQMDSINIVVSLEPKPNYQKHEQAFIVETFQRSEGLRVVVHETGSYPDIAQDGLHVEPGKMNEIKYQPVQHRRVNSPAKPCVPSYGLSAFRDLDRDFIMDKKNCILLTKQMLIMEHCKCIFVSLPRPVEPTDDLPYCGEITRDKNISTLITRIDCISGILSDPDFQKNLEKTTCFPRCDSLAFESTISITKWGATAWHLHWIRRTNKALNLAKYEHERMRVTDTTGYQMWLDYANKENLSDIRNLKDDFSLKGENFAYVVLQRKSKNTLFKQEKLVTTPYVLLSRIGGVCSLTIGLTAAFVVEFIEFLYRFCNHTEEKSQFCQNQSSMKSEKSPRNSSKSDKKKNQQNLNIYNDNQIRTITFRDSATATNEI